MQLTKTKREAVGATSRAVIEATDLTKIYGSGGSRVEALAGVSLSVNTGEWVSLVGPSGSGKSTLMNLLGLLDRPTGDSYSLGAGRYEPPGRVGQAPSFPDAARRRLGAPDLGQRKPAERLPARMTGPGFVPGAFDSVLQ